MTATDPTSIDERNKIRCGVCGTPWDCHPADTICCRHRPAPPRVRKRVRVPVVRIMEPVPGMRVFYRTDKGIASYTANHVGKHTVAGVYRWSTGTRYPYKFETSDDWRYQCELLLGHGHLVAVTVPNAEAQTIGGGR